MCPVLRALMGRLGEPYAEPTGENRARAAQPPCHRDLLPSRRTTAKTQATLVCSTTGEVTP